jgi:hypothetical protein
MLLGVRVHSFVRWFSVAIGTYRKTAATVDQPKLKTALAKQQREGLRP